MPKHAIYSRVDQVQTGVVMPIFFSHNGKFFYLSLVMSCDKIGAKGFRN